MEISGFSGFFWVFGVLLGFSGFLDIPSSFWVFLVLSGYLWIFMDISDFSGSSSKTGEGGATKI